MSKYDRDVHNKTFTLNRNLSQLVSESGGSFVVCSGMWGKFSMNTKRLIKPANYR